MIIRGDMAQGRHCPQMNTPCMGAKCMLWRWLEDMKGYCGLGNKPEKMV